MSKKLLHTWYTHFYILDTLTFYILDNLSGNKNKAVVQEKELFWTHLLINSYPFGNSDSIKSYGNISARDNPLIFKPNHPYFNLSIVKEKKRNSHKPKKQKTLSNVVEETYHFIDFGKSADTYNTMKNELYKLKAKVIKSIIVKCYNGEILKELTKEKDLFCFVCFVGFNIIVKIKIITYLKILNLNVVLLKHFIFTNY